MNKLDLISVIVPLYNKEKWVERCIKSIISQTYQNIEILIINDGSTDDSAKIASAIEDWRIKIFDKPNGGVSSARNLGIEKAKGEYIALIDADDEWNSKHLETMKDGFYKFKDVVLVCDNLIETKVEKKEFVQKRNLPYYLKNNDETTNQYFLIDDYLGTLKDNFFILSGSSVLIKLSVIKEHQLQFYEHLAIGEDVNYWLQLSQVGKFVFCDYLGLLYHRIDDKSAMNKKRKEVQLVPEFFYGINMENYNKSEMENVKKFLTREYYKKAYQNRGLLLNSDELSTQMGGGVQINELSILPYLVIRYCPQFVFNLYRKLRI